MSRTGDWARILLCYVLWLVSGGVGIWLLSLVHSLTRLLSRAGGLNRWEVGAIVKFAVPVLGLVWLIAVLAMEHWYRTGAAQGTLLRRFGWVTAIQAVLAVIAVATIMVLN